MTPAHALTRFLSAFGVTGQDVPQDLDDLAARYRSEIADRRMLIVLDNAGSVEQVRPLLPGSSSSTVVVTSRDSLAGLVAVHGAHRIDLDLLPPGEAVMLLRRLIGPRVNTEPEVAATLADQCARLPLALRVAAELAASRPTIMLAELVAELAGQQQRLDLLNSGGDPRAAVRTVFSWSVQHLPPDAAATFRLLGLHPGPDVGIYAAAALASINLEDAHRRLELLSRAHLLQPNGPGRYGMHDLLRAYAAELTRTHDTEQVRHAALSRSLDHYRHTASVAMDTAYSYDRERRPQVPSADTPTPDLSDPNQAIGWLDIELPNLLAAARHAADHRRAEHTLNLSAILHRHLLTRGRYSDAEALHYRALTTARTIGDRTGELTALVGLGWAYTHQGRHEQASDHFGPALEIARAIGDRTGELTALRGLGWAYTQQRRHEQAIDHFGPALEIARAIGDRTGELTALNGYGWVHSHQDRHEQAIDYFGAALEIARTINNRNGELAALHGLGHIYQVRGRYGQALDRYQQALEVARATGNRYGELAALTGVGHVHRRQGRYERALDHYQQALEVARTTGNREGELAALHGLGHIHQLQRRCEHAADRYQEVLDLARETGHRNWQFEAIHGLGRLHHASGHPDTALAHHRGALELAIDLGQPADQARAHDGLAHAQSALNQPEEARQHWQRALDILTNLGTDHTEDRETNTSTLRAHLAALADR